MDTQTTGRRKYRAHRDPVWIDERRKIGGEVLRLCASLQKQIALAFRAHGPDDLGSSEGQVSKLCAGDPAGDRYMERVEALASSPYTDPGPLAAAPLAMIARVYAERFTQDELDDALRLVLQRETSHEGPENDAQVALLLAHDLSGDELAVIEDELAERFVRSMAAEAVAVGMLWEKRRRRRAGR